jgi:hypothetical protein
LLFLHSQSLPELQHSIISIDALKGKESSSGHHQEPLPAPSNYLNDDNTDGARRTPPPTKPAIGRGRGGEVGDVRHNVPPNAIDAASLQQTAQDAQVQHTMPFARRLPLDLGGAASYQLSQQLNQLAMRNAAPGVLGAESDVYLRSILDQSRALQTANFPPGANAIADILRRRQQEEQYALQGNSLQNIGAFIRNQSGVTAPPLQQNAALLQLLRGKAEQEQHSNALASFLASLAQQKDRKQAQDPDDRGS